jgi:hypothetical protein
MEVVMQVFFRNDDGTYENVTSTLSHDEIEGAKAQVAKDVKNRPDIKVIAACDNDETNKTMGIPLLAIDIYDEHDEDSIKGIVEGAVPAIH